MSREEWRNDVEQGNLVDYDGEGSEIDKNGAVVRKKLKPSDAFLIRPETRYILWYNR